MTPFGHASISYLIGRTTPKLDLRAVLAGGIIPDCDFLLFPFPWFNQIHRVITHNLLFICLVGIIGTVFCKHNQRSTILISLLIGGIFHLIADSCIDSNPSNGIGVALFYPFSEALFSPFNLAETINSPLGWSDPGVMFMAMIKTLWLEMPFWFAAIFLWFFPRTRGIWDKNRQKIYLPTPRQDIPPDKQAEKEIEAALEDE